MPCHAWCTLLRVESSPVLFSTFSFYLKKWLDFLPIFKADHSTEATLTNTPPSGLPCWPKRFFFSVMKHIGVGVFCSCTRWLHTIQNAGCFKRNMTAQKIRPSESDWPRQRMIIPLFQRCFPNWEQKRCRLCRNWSCVFLWFSWVTTRDCVQNPGIPSW